VATREAGFPIGLVARARRQQAILVVGDGIDGDLDRIQVLELDHDAQRAGADDRAGAREHADAGTERA
jgi:hypothetical protein